MLEIIGMAEKMEVRRLCRLTLVVFMTIGLMFSLLHCATCDLDFDSIDGAAVVSSIDPISIPDLPEHFIPCHHCLSHVAVQQLSMLVAPVDIIPVALSYPPQSFSAASPGLPLFKPPRA